MGRARACVYGAATIINAIATWKGCAFSIGMRSWAEVEVGKDLHGVEAHAEARGITINPKLAKLCASLVIERLGYDGGAYVETWSEIPVASGLKSSSAASNAVALATCAAIGAELNEVDVIRMAVDACRLAGVTITGAFDDACASMLGGLVITDNRRMKLLRREEFDRKIMVLIPPRRSYSGKVDVKKIAGISGIIRRAFEFALRGEYERAMIINGICYAAALGFSREPILQALKAGARAAGLSGTGPSYVALIDRDIEWIGRGEIIKLRSNNSKAEVWVR